VIPYVGGKSRQAKWINLFVPKRLELYIEPFSGGFWTYIKGDFETKRAIYNDFNPYMANIFACCKEPDKYLSYLKSVDAQDRAIFDKFKQDVISTTEFVMPDFELGMKYIYVLTQTFSGIMSPKVKMVDLHGKYKSKYYAFINKLENPKIRKRLEKLEVLNQSFEQVIEQYDSKDTFFYLDPPYYKKEHLYAFHEFGRSHHEQLASILQKIKGKFILSYYEYDELSEWYPQDKYIWEKKDYFKASMATKGKKQSVGTELLVMNYKSVIEV
jgi:DNA adenine methylase